MCLFCKIIAGEIPSRKVYEDENFLAFLDIGPVSEGHTLVLPKIHCETLSDLPPELAGPLMEVVQKVAMKIQDELAFEGYNILINNGKAAYQEVPHLHVHIIGANADGTRIGLKFKTLKLSDQEFDAILEKIST